MAPPPEFPPPFVIERTRSLGFGTGPWRREDLVRVWGEPTADKFVADAKAAGWLVSPYRGTYHVPAAQDLMLVSWLPEPSRLEFLVSRTLSSAGVRYWCLSDWARARGLDLGAPVFVTDLTTSKAPPEVTPTADRKALRAAVVLAAERLGTLPYLENLLIVPQVPALDNRPSLRLALVPEDLAVEDRRKSLNMLSTAGIGAIGTLVWLFTKEYPREFADIGSLVRELEDQEKQARGIAYSLGAPVVDFDWIAAVLLSLGTARIEEFLATWRKSERLAPTGIQRWAGLIGPPQPNENWKEAIRNGPFPFLLVPPTLWQQMGADQASRRFRILSSFGGG